MDRRITKCDRSGVNMNKKENIMKKKLTAILLAAAMAVTGLFTAMTPEKAKEAGSDYIVVGRPITGADDPAAAYERCLKGFIG